MCRGDFSAECSVKSGRCLGLARGRQPNGGGGGSRGEALRPLASPMNGDCGCSVVGSRCPPNRRDCASPRNEAQQNFCAGELRPQKIVCLGLPFVPHQTKIGECNRTKCTRRLLACLGSGPIFTKLKRRAIPFMVAECPSNPCSVCGACAPPPLASSVSTTCAGDGVFTINVAEEDRPRRWRAHRLIARPAALKGDDGRVRLPDTRQILGTSGFEEGAGCKAVRSGSLLEAPTNLDITV